MKNRIPPPIVGIVAAIIMWLVAQNTPALAFDFGGRSILAAVFASAGLALDFVSVAGFFRAKTTVNPLAPERAEKLVTGGFYRFIRNPMYLGMALLLTAWGLWLGNAASLAGVALFMAYITKFQIIPEEVALAAKFGDEFEAYKATVRRWL